MHIVSKTKVLALIALLGLVGCASAPQAPVSLDLGVNKTFTFSKDADGNKAYELQIANAMVQSIMGSTHYKPRFEQFAGSNGFFNVKGIEVVRKPNAIEISYVNGERSTITNRTILTRTSAVIAYSIEENAGAVTFKVSPPKQMDTVKAVNPIYIPYPTLDGENELASDVKKIYGNLDPILRISKPVKAEIDSKYGVAAIKANFKRKCKYGNVFIDGMGREKENGTCVVGSTEVTVAVQPYKDGSKVTYNFNALYELNGRGESTYSPEAIKSVVASLDAIVKD
jgi:hypothetical protein